MQMLQGKMFYCSCGARNTITNRACTTCGAVFKDTVLESRNGRRLGVVRRDATGRVIGVERSGITLEKIGKFLLWFYFLPVMLSIHAFKKKELKWHIIAGIVWIVYIIVIIGYEVSKRGTQS